ncbi:GNAT family N-acetyltransferase [Rathayibacter festucae]|uniref:GNAT family N-acetyltransferase n=1 Tax=Rathayibacter festucae TaxID=110937 RepID=UPI002A6B7D0F|nr:GNAT family N-acetyltransferase [Rathayibacter festucae]MDY0911599.1 GNAT family N-acetyltransferase [Rathayibacter festucae]
MQLNSVISKAWSELTTEEVYGVARLRTDVFLREQRVDDEELDGRDLEPTTRHWWIADERGVAAYLRTLWDERPEHRDAHRVVGRVVTRADRRGEGLAHRLVRAVVDRHGDEPLLLHAQTYVAGLYARSGFEAFGDEFDEAGIAHIGMHRSASRAPGAALPTVEG